MSFSRLLPVVVPACLVSSAALAQNLVTNGSFEVGPVVPSNPGFVNLTTGSTAITGWTVTGSNVDLVRAALNPSEGFNCIDLDGLTGTAGGVRQDVPTVPQGHYTLEFDLAGNPNSGPTIKTVRVTIGTTPPVSTDFTFSIAGLSRSNMGFVPRTLAFTAAGASTAIGFTSLTGTGWGPVIDRVGVYRDPAVRSGPVSRASCPGGTVTFEVTPLGTGPFTYAWSKDGTPIDPELNPTALAATLMLSGVGSADEGSYTCSVTNAFGSATSLSAALTLCPTDFNCDQSVNADDLGDFINCYFATPRCEGADFNHDGSQDPDDLGDYINAFFLSAC